jgi:HD-GYP domain-containing protein (c-di-GMP phosphodiesterase class II)
MTSERVYRRRVAPEQAIAELRRCAGTQFDPVIVDAIAEEIGEHTEPPRVAAVAS